MFCQNVVAAWEAGKTKIGLPALGHGDQVHIEARGLTRFQAWFLSGKERRMLAGVSKTRAIAAAAKVQKRQ